MRAKPLHATLESVALHAVLACVAVLGSRALEKRNQRPMARDVGIEVELMHAPPPEPQPAPIVSNTAPPPPSTPAAPAHVGAQAPVAPAPVRSAHRILTAPSTTTTAAPIPV